MNDNLMVVETMEDGRWNDESWLNEQATISAMNDAADNGLEIQ